MTCVGVYPPLFTSGLKAQFICSLFVSYTVATFFHEALLLVFHVLFVHNTISNIRICLNKRPIKQTGLRIWEVHLNR